jgi:hypothetical protein
LRSPPILERRLTVSHWFVDVYGPAMPQDPPDSGFRSHRSLRSPALLPNEPNETATAQKTILGALDPGRKS